MAAKILILEDEARMRRLLELILREPGYQVRAAADGRQGIKIWRQWQPDLVLSDLKMPEMDGLEVLRFRNAQFPAVPMIILTAFGTVETAVAAMKEGAYDYLTKPVDNNKVLALAARALTAGAGPGRRRMIGSSTVMKKLRAEINLLVKTDSSVLITGESGTGKEPAAMAIHEVYGSRDSPFVRVNCPAIPKDLLESELFGHRRGSFTGAVEDRPGAFVRADGGILFLDEIGDLPLSLQPKLLHAVEEKKVMPVGGSRERRVRVKIIAATNRDLEAMVESGGFRRDLFYRLSVLQLRLPPLRQRREDVEELADYFLKRLTERYGGKTPCLDQEALELMRNYDWPGNIRELRNVMERGFLRGGGHDFSVELLPEIIGLGQKNTGDGGLGRDNYDLAGRERELILLALRESGWNQSRAAQKLGLTRNTLRYRIKKHGIRQDE